MTNRIRVDMPNTTCSVGQCDRGAKARGWCMPHYQQWYKGTPLVERVITKECPQCSESFTVARSRIYCSQRCRELAKYAMLRDNPERWAEYLERERAGYVKKTEQPGYVRPSRPAQPCSEDECDRPSASRDMCAMHYKRWARANGMVNSPSDGWSPARKAQWRKRKALMRGASSAEVIDYTAVFERDHYTCQLCSKPVDRALTHPNPMSVSLDHRIPVIDGGTHTYDNVQCSHLVCNMRKGRKHDPTEQLAAG